MLFRSSRGGSLGLQARHLSLGCFAKLATPALRVYSYYLLIKGALTPVPPLLPRPAFVLVVGLHRETRAGAVLAVGRGPISCGLIHVVQAILTRCRSTREPSQLLLSRRG